MIDNKDVNNKLFKRKVVEWSKSLVCYTRVLSRTMGSNPILSVLLIYNHVKRVSVNGKRFAFQAETVGSIPTTRKNN